jgi:hypothetical protein
VFAERCLAQHTGVSEGAAIADISGLPAPPAGSAAEGLLGWPVAPVDSATVGLPGLQMVRAAQTVQLVQAGPGVVRAVLEDGQADTAALWVFRSSDRSHTS